MSGVAILYLNWNRREFAEATFRQLLSATNWDLCHSLTVYDDGSEDGAREVVGDLIGECPVPYELRETPNVGPVGVMNHFIANTDSEWFMKTDSDIVLPPKYLDALIQVRDEVPHLDAIGMEAGRTTLPPHPKLPEGFVYGYEPARHIGGVGLIRTLVLGLHPQMTANGRYGWTEHQERYNVTCAWIHPDLYVPSLDRVPEEPWISLTEEYFRRGWLRNELPSKYHERWMARYWHWWSHPDA